MANVLVTGGTGLIGSEVVRQLVHAGHAAVAFEFLPNAANVEDVSESVTVVQGDTTDLPRLVRTAGRRRIDRIIHLAAFIRHESTLDPMRAVHVNAIGGGNVLDAAVALEVERVVIASTVAVYGPAALYGDRLVTEDDVPAPTAIYGATKLVGEMLARAYRESFGLDVVSIRPVLAYGVGRLVGGTGVFNAAIRDIALGNTAHFDNYRDLQVRIQPIYVKDMAETFVRAAFHGTFPRDVYNAPVSEWYTVEQAIEVMRRVVPGARVELDVPKSGGWVGPMSDGTLLQTELGFKPRYSFEDGVREMVEAFRAAEAVG